MDRIFAALIALLTLAALFAQFFVSSALMGTPGPSTVLWRMAGYFTVLTNSLVAVTFLIAAARNKPVGAIWAAGLTLWICAVGAVYHAILAAIWEPVGLAWWADQGLHSAVPALVLLWWLTLADKRGLHWRHALLWLIWPAVYCVYALIRGATSGFYPYPFLDLDALTSTAVAVNIVGLVLAFAAGGLALVALSKRLDRAA